MKDVFKEFQNNLLEARINREAENQALEMRKEAQIKYVLRKWIDVGNYWLEKSKPEDHPQTLFTKTPLKSQILSSSPLKPSPNSTSKESPQPEFSHNNENDFSFTLSKDITSDPPNSSPSPQTPEISSKEKDLKSWLFKKVNSIKSKTRSPTQPKKHSQILSESASLDRESSGHPSPETATQHLQNVHTQNLELELERDLGQDPQVENPFTSLPSESHCSAYDSPINKILSAHEDFTADQEVDRAKEEEIRQREIQQIKRLQQIKQGRIQQLQERGNFLKTQIGTYEKLQHDLKKLEYQYTMTGDERVILHARQLAANLKALHQVVPQFMLELNSINMEMSKFR